MPDAHLQDKLLDARNALCGDIDFQLRFIADSAWRLVATQDRDPSSPSLGCFHTAYWRDKTSEFPDARFQEAAAALGLLSLDEFESIREDVGAPDKETLRAAFLNGAKNLTAQQYKDGCYDEWYKGERGFAATAFTNVAFGFALLFLRDEISREDHDSLVETLRRAADWLSAREDVVKINHEVVAIVSLAIVWKLTGEQKYLAAAREKLRVSLDHRDTEGWFRELNGADLGYSFLVFDYLMLFRWLADDQSVDQIVDGLLDFLIPHLHPDFTTSAEGGTCRNPYVGQIGFVLLDPESRRGDTFVGALAGLKSNRRRILPYLADELRISRWAVLPVLAGLFWHTRNKAPVARDGFAELYPQGWTASPAACLAAYHSRDLHVFVPAAGGAVTRVFVGEDLVVEDLGYSISLGSKQLTSKVYNADRTLTLNTGELQVGFGLSKPTYFFPTFAQRFLLRLGSTTAVGSRLTRAAIDWYRTRKRTAINQSAASVGRDDDGIILTRTVKPSESRVEIVDQFEADDAILTSDMFILNLKVDGSQTVAIDATFKAARKVRIAKTFELSGAPVLATITVSTQ